MGWRWLTRGDELARELAADRRFAAERGVNRLQDRLEAAAEPRAVRALAGLRDLGTRAALLDAARERLAPADAEVLAVVTRMRSATLADLEKLAALRASPAGRGGPGSEEAEAAAERVLAGVEGAVSRMAVAVGRLESRRLAGPARSAAEPAGLDELTAELEASMAVAQRVEERLAEIDGGRLRE